MDNIVNLSDWPFHPSGVSSIEINTSSAALKSPEETKLWHDKDKNKAPIW